MRKVNVLGKYDIAIGERLIERAGMAIKRVCKGKKCCVVSDNNVAPLYAETVLDSLSQSGIEPSMFVFEHGEKSKNISTITQMLNFFAQQELTRSDFVVALGGGGSSKVIIGDRIERVFNFKDPLEYIRRFDEILTKKDEILSLMKEES